MSRLIVVSVPPLLTAAMMLGGCAPPNAVGPQAVEEMPEAESPEILAHIENARANAGTDITAPFEFYCVPGNARGNSRTAPVLEPVRLFDNLYAVGNSETIVHVITTPDGIILIDSGYPGRVETEVVPGLIELGLDPADVRYVLLGHGHGDHYGGASYFQDRYGARVGTMAVDWDLIEEAAASADGDDPVPPTRDLVLTEGVPVTLGGTSVTPVSIPGHTQGSLAYIFPVTDGGTPHMAGLFGGTILGVGRITTPGLRQYVESIAHYLETAVEMNVDVEVQNHAIFDDTPERLARLAAREVGDPHPFVMGTNRYVRFWNVISECIQAEIVRRGDAE
jgi:metallo-beta-lactamase class B